VQPTAPHRPFVSTIVNVGSYLT